MIQKIENTLSITVNSVSSKGIQAIDLSEATNIIFAIRQCSGQYIELQASLVEDHVIVKIPFDKAMLLTTTPTKVQLMWTDKDGNKYATKIKEVNVEHLLKESGYD